MTTLVVEQQERSAAQDDTQPPNQAARKQHIAVDGLAMSIDIAGEHMDIWRLFSSLYLPSWVPELGGPTGKGIGETVGSISMSHL